MALNFTPAYMTPKPEKKPFTPAPAESLLADIPKSYEGFSQSPTKVVQAPINRPVITPAKEPTKAAAWDFGPQSFVDNGKEGDAAAKKAADEAANRSTLGEKGLSVEEQMDIADRQMKRGKYAEIERPILQSTAPSFSGQDEAKIREEELARQRARIDAVNQLYVDEYRKAKERATARTGTQRAQSAARGTIGSDFGTAEQQAVTDINVSEEDAIRAKQNAEIQAIMNESDKSIQDRVAKAQALILAQQERADKLKAEQDQLAIQTGQLDLAKEKAKQDAIAAGIKPVETNDGSIINAITGEVIYQGKPKAQGPIELSPGATLYDTTTGKPLYTAPGKASTGNGDELLSPTEAIALGVKYGTTRDQAAALGIQPEKPLTAEQSKVATYAQRMAQANEVIDKIGKDFTGVTAIGGSLPNIFQTGDRQAFEQSKVNFATAVLRRESGAAIAPSEFVSVEKLYFPRAGDGEDVLKQKEQARKTVIDNFISEAKGAYLGDKGGVQATNEEIQALMKANNMTEAEVRAELGKTNDLSTSQNGSIKLGSPLAVANNNPGNLRFVGQPGAVQGKGGFAKFSTPEAGVQAMKNLLVLRKNQGMTLSQLINSYAPPVENDTGLYIKQISSALNVPPNTPLSQIDINALARAMAKKESSTIIG